MVMVDDPASCHPAEGVAVAARNVSGYASPASTNHAPVTSSWKFRLAKRSLYFTYLPPIKRDTTMYTASSGPSVIEATDLNAPRVSCRAHPYTSCSFRYVSDSITPSSRMHHIVFCGSSAHAHSTIWRPATK